MNAKKCDRCAKLYEDYRDKENRGNAIRLGYREVSNGFGGIELFDLCPACMESFRNWMKEGKQNG